MWLPRPWLPSCPWGEYKLDCVGAVSSVLVGLPLGMLLRLSPAVVLWFVWYRNGCTDTCPRYRGKGAVGGFLREVTLRLLFLAHCLVLGFFQFRSPTSPLDLSPSGRLTVSVRPQ